VFVRPPDLADDDVRAVLAEHWGIRPATIEYAAVGFGSHHWLTESHFVTVDEPDLHVERAAALATARALRVDADLEFVHAALPAADGRLIVPFADRWLVHVHDRLEVVDDTRHGPHDDPEVVALLRRIHEATPIVGHHARVEDFGIWDRDDLERALTRLDERWETGPYAEPCRAVLREHEGAVRAALAEHDAIVAGVGRDGWVVTHGEPHRGNVFRTTAGWKVVDWDTALLAPPERDWWDVDGGRHGDPTLVDLYSLRWDLLEVACYVSEYVVDHVDDRNTQESWANYLTYLGRLETRARSRA